MGLEERILYLGFGRAGREVFERFIAPVYAPQNIFVVTYENAENAEFLESLRRSGHPFIVESLKSESAFQKVAAFRPTVILSIHFRDLVAKRILDLAPRKNMNVHPSLLPRYAGCFATMWAIIEGETETGVSYHRMTERFDEGHILHQKVIGIGPDGTGEGLYNRAIDVAVDEFEKAFGLLLSGFIGRAQTGPGSYHPRQIPYEGIIDPTWSQEKVDRFIRAMVFTGKKGAILETAHGPREVRTWADYVKFAKGRE